MKILELSKEQISEALSSLQNDFGDSFFYKPNVEYQKVCPDGLEAANEFFAHTIESEAENRDVKNTSSELDIIRVQQKLNFAKTFQQDYNLRYNYSRRQALCNAACNSKRLARNLDGITNARIIR